MTGRLRARSTSHAVAFKGVVRRIRCFRVSDLFDAAGHRADISILLSSRHRRFVHVGTRACIETVRLHRCSGLSAVRETSHSKSLREVSTSRPSWRRAVPFAYSGSCVAWGIPFEVGRPVILGDQPLTVEICRPRLDISYSYMHLTVVRVPSTRMDLSLPCEESVSWRSTRQIMS